MKRIAVLLFVATVFGLMAAVAQADPVERSRGARSPDDVAAYWTAERMRNARPAPLAKGGAGGGGKRPSAGAATEIPAPYTVPPTSTNGKVFFTEKGINYVCSGTAVTSGNRNTVWTAGHCVNEGPGAFVTNWMFAPAYRDGATPYGKWAAASGGLYTSSGWQNSGDFTYDVGAAKVTRPSSSSCPSGCATTLTETVGGRPLAFNYNANQRYNSYGYPAASPFNGQRLWMCDSQLYLRDGSRSFDPMGIQCNMTGGSSGGGWVVPGSGTGGGFDAVYSVNSYGYASLRNVMFGPYQGSVAQSVYTTAAGS